MSSVSQTAARGSCYFHPLKGGREKSCCSSLTVINKVLVKLSLCCLEHHAMNTYGEMEVEFQVFLTSGTRWRWVVSIMSQTIYPRGKSPRYLGGPQSRSGRSGEERNLLILSGVESWLLVRPARGPVICFITTSPVLDPEKPTTSHSTTQSLIWSWNSFILFTSSLPISVESTSM
jgi:hypothetical protein